MNEEEEEEEEEVGVGWACFGWSEAVTSRTVVENTSEEVERAKESESRVRKRNGEY